MSRIIGILLFVAALWFMASQYTDAHAPQDDGETQVRATDRVRDSVTSAQQEAEERRNRLLPE